MAETLVVCGDAPKPRSARDDILLLDAYPQGNPQHRIGLELDAIAQPFVDNLPNLLADILEFAAYIYSADRLRTRGSAVMTDMGARWRRKFRFRIALRCPEIWNQPEVQIALADALSFLSEDEFAFEFSKTRRTQVSRYLGFSDPKGQVIEPDEVILFSGGLDSTAGVAERLIGGGKRAALVTHNSAKLLVGRQSDLVAALRERVPPRRLFHVPIWVTKGEQEPAEFTQRTRSLLFAALGIVVARMFNKESILFFENGITSFNLPIAEHVLGTRASRTTHPRVFRSFERLFSLLLNTHFEIRNPFLWSTKREVVETLGRHGCADLISMTVSCANVRQLPMTSKQCGICSQCVERRFATLAAGFGEQDSAQAYAVDLFRGMQTRVDDITMAECHVLRAQKLASMSEIAFLATYGQIFRALSDLSGSAIENARRIYELHRRYGRYVVEGIDAELQRSASLAQTLALPDTSLLSMINAPIGLQSAYVDPVEKQPAPSSQDGQPVAERRFIFAVDNERRQIIFADGPNLRGVGYQLISRLSQQLRIDIDSRGSGKKAAFVNAKKLAADLGIDDAALRMRIMYTRRSLKTKFLNCIDYSIDEQDVIQSQIWQGYRLNPHLVLVDVGQLRDDRTMTTFSKDITTPRTRR